MFICYGYVLVKFYKRSKNRQRGRGGENDIITAYTTINYSIFQKLEKKIRLKRETKYYTSISDTTNGSSDNKIYCDIITKQ